MSEPNYKPTIADLAVKFCQAHREDYEAMKNSDSMDVDADFMLLCEAVWAATTETVGSIRERLQGIARAVGQRLPERYGFVLFCFPFNAPPDHRGEYASNAKREDVVRMLQNFIDANPMQTPERN